MLPSKDKFKFQVAPSDRQLWAIGLVVVTWTHIEQLIQVVAHSLTTETSPERIEFNQTRAFKLRLDQVKAIIEAELRPPYRETFLNLVAETRITQDLRDKIVHNSWGGGGTDGSDARGVFNWSKPRPAFDWKLDFGGIKAVAVRIDALAYAWNIAVIEDETGSNILFSAALQRKRHTSP